MKYTTEEELAEIKKRSKRVIYKNNQRSVRILGSMTGVTFALLCLMIRFIPERTMETTQNSVYGALILGERAGGYVLIAVVAFALGILVTLFVHKHRALSKPESEE